MPQHDPRVMTFARRVQWVRHWIAEQWQHYWQGRNPLPAILVYQMGKVGSRTVYDTLLSLDLANPVYHIHWLSSANIEAEIRHYRRAGIWLPSYVRTGQFVSRQIRRHGEREWWIITLVRDPIARQLSEFFQLMWLLHPELLDEEGCVRTEQSLEVVQTVFADYEAATDKCNTWFDSELKQVFGIDVYSHPFDQEAGYTVIEQGRIRLLVLRLEDLSRQVGLLGEFVGYRRPIALVRANEAQQHSYAESYKNAVTQFRIPEATCQTIYASRYAQHFFSPAMRAAFVRRWAGEAA